MRASALLTRREKKHRVFFQLKLLLLEVAERDVAGQVRLVCVFFKERKREEEKKKEQKTAHGEFRLIPDGVHRLDVPRARFLEPTLLESDLFFPISFSSFPKKFEKNVRARR